MTFLAEQIRRISRFTRDHPWIAMVLVAFALRLGIILIHLAHRTYQFSPYLQHFTFGAETGSVARSVAEGEGFSSPFMGSTGPTSWVGPIYVYLLAAIFKMFGVYTPASGMVILAINSLFSAFTSAAVYFLGVRLGNRVAGLLGGWAWAFIPFFMSLCTTWVWETSLSALLVAVALLFAIDLCDSASWKKWAAFGAFWGFCALVNPALASCFPISLAWIGFRSHIQKIAWKKNAVMAMLACVVTISPWLVRNRVVFGQWVFIRSNFAFEFYLDNHPISEREWWFGVHPSVNASEHRRYQQMGEVAYVKMYGDKALQYVKENPTVFFSKTVDRFFRIWTAGVFTYISRGAAPPLDLQPQPILTLLAIAGLGVGAATKLRHWPLLLGLVIFYPAPYYVTFPAARYLHPIHPIMLFVSSYFVVEAFHMLKNRRSASKHSWQIADCSLQRAPQQGFSLIEVLIVAAIVLIISAIAIPSLLRAKISANEASAVSSVRSICSAQISYKMFYPDVGYAPTLDNLGPTGAGLVDSNLTTAPYQHSGYQYTSVGQKDTFAVTADPLNPGVSGVRSFCSDTPAAIYMATASAGETCVIGTNPLR